jgi:predicted GNAT family acetyltransferase
MRFDHVLDRPVWSALTRRQAHLAQGDGPALRLDPDYGLFAGAADASPDSLAALADLVPARGDLWVVEMAEWPPVPGTARVTHPVCQMVAHDLRPVDTSAFEIVPLTDADAPQMRALVALTEPGPFFARTHQLGDFIGVKQDGVLVAMAGERMKPQGFTEVSGVCTHPDHRGRGYAGVLTSTVAARIADRGETPFLHVYPGNTGAIALYETLGFTRRGEITLTVLSRA